MCSSLGLSCRDGTNTYFAGKQKVNPYCTRTVNLDHFSEFLNFSLSHSSRLRMLDDIAVKSDNNNTCPAMLMCFGDNTALRLQRSGSYHSILALYKPDVHIHIILTGSNDINVGADNSSAMIESPFVLYCNGDWARNIEFRYSNRFMFLLAIIVNVAFIA